MKTKPLKATYPKSIVHRFWEKVHRLSSDECWPWIAARNRWGYGIFNLRQHGLVNIGAHRFAHAISSGGVRANKLVCHSCDNRACCNPSHLWSGTIDDNMDDRNSKGRQARGKRNANSILTEDQVLAIHRDGRTMLEIAAAYGVGYYAIVDVKNGRNWGWLTGRKYRRAA